MRPRSIRARLTLWYTGLLTLTMLLLGGVAYGLLGYSLARDMDRALQGVAVVLAEQPARGRVPAVSPDIEAFSGDSSGWPRGTPLSSGVNPGVPAPPRSRPPAPSACR